MDEGLRCLDLMLGVDKSAVFDLSDILMGKEIDDAVYKVDGANGLYLIPAPAQIGKIDAFAFSVLPKMPPLFTIRSFSIFLREWTFRFTAVCRKKRCF